MLPMKMFARPSCESVTIAEHQEQAADETPPSPCQPLIEQVSEPKNERVFHEDDENIRDVLRVHVVKIIFVW